MDAGMGLHVTTTFCITVPTYSKLHFSIKGMSSVKLNNYIGFCPKPRAVWSKVLTYVQCL